MPDIRTLALIIFAAGVVLLAAGVLGLPLSEILLVIGSAWASFAYATVFLNWRASRGLPQADKGGAKLPSLTGPTAPTQPQAPSLTTGTPTPPADSGVAEPSTPEAKLPTAKAPRFQLPEPVVQNKMPIGLVIIGLILVIAAVAILLPTLLYFAILFIPGVLFLGIGGALLFVRMRRAVPIMVEVKRFCMHCGFQMSSTDVACPRCRRQPPSGVDTKVCPNCGAVIPALAKFCRDCGAGQPTAAQ